MWVNYQNGEKPPGVLLYVPMIPPRGGDMGGRLEMGPMSRIYATVKTTRSLPLEYPASITQAIFYQEPKSTDSPPTHTHTHFNHLSLSIQSTNRMSELLIGGYY